MLALYQHPGQHGGKLAVVGSAAMLRFVFSCDCYYSFPLFWSISKKLAFGYTPASGWEKSQLLPFYGYPSLYLDDWRECWLLGESLLQWLVLSVVFDDAVLSDQYIDKEDNNRVKDVLLSFLTSDDVKLNKIDAEDPEVQEQSLSS